MNKNDDILLESIKHRLDLLIYIQLRADEISHLTLGEQIFQLKQMGLLDGDIASIFGKSKSYVSGEIVRQKKRKK
jgi:hypothetical protein